MIAKTIKSILLAMALSISPFLSYAAPADNQQEQEDGDQRGGIGGFGVKEAAAAGAIIGLAVWGISEATDKSDSTPSAPAGT